MSKIVIIPNNKDNIYNLLNSDNYLLIGIEDYSVNTLNISFEEIIELTKKYNNIFLSMNKNIYNNELEYVEKVLIQIDKLNIKGLFYYDVGILNIVKRLNLNINLIWSCEHYTTNYFTINYWYNNGVKSTFLSNEITLNEIEEIIDNTKSSLFVQLFGYIPMYVSKRHAVKNYLNHFNLDINSNRYYLFKEDKKYSIIDNKNGTIIYTNFILNGLSEYLKIMNKIDYVILNGYDISDDKLNDIISIFKEVNTDNIDSLNSKIDKMFNNLEKGFLYEETIYRVKKNDR